MWMHEVADVVLRVLSRSALTVRKAPSAVALQLIAIAALLVTTPSSVSAAPHLDGVDAGANHTCTVVSAAVFCWGRNVDGRIGDGSGRQRTTAVPVDTDGVLAGLRMTRISGGGTHTCALSSAGRAYCWGAGSGGQLGDGHAVRRTSPVAVDSGMALSGVALTRISAGWFHTCAVSAAGRAYCWGKGGGGRLGDGAAVSRTSPVPVRTDGVTLVEIGAGRAHTCAVSSAGGVYCWGAGGSGQLGNGRVVRAPVPVPVDTSGALSGVTVTQIATGANHTCALSSTG
jgi:alpha-tubulin suppressor-like RCC1 family protein